MPDSSGNRDEIFIIPCPISPAGIPGGITPEVLSGSETVISTGAVLEASGLRKDMDDLSRQIFILQSSVDTKFELLETKVKSNEKETALVKTGLESLKKDLKRLSERLGEIDLQIVNYESHTDRIVVKASETVSALDDIRGRMEDLDKKIEVIVYDRFQKDNEQYDRTRVKAEEKTWYEKILSHKYTGAAAVLLAIILKIL